MDSHRDAGRMTSLRGHVHRHRWLAAALIIMTLLITILVPAGYMPSMVDGAFVMRPCDGQRVLNPMADMVMPSGDHAHADRPDHHDGDGSPDRLNTRSEEHTSELQSLMRTSYAVFCLKKKTTKHS